MTHLILPLPQVNVAEKLKGAPRQQLSNRSNHWIVSTLCFIGCRCLLDVLSGEKGR
jgi:hypothetical protein